MLAAPFWYGLGHVMFWAVLGLRGTGFVGWFCVGVGVGWCILGSWAWVTGLGFMAWGLFGFGLGCWALGSWCLKV